MHVSQQYRPVSSEGCVMYTYCTRLETKPLHHVPQSIQTDLSSLQYCKTNLTPQEYTKVMQNRKKLATSGTDSRLLVLDCWIWKNCQLSRWGWPWPWPWP